MRSETPLVELPELFSAEECAREIARATKIGFQAQQFRGEERVEECEIELRSTTWIPRVFCGPACPVGCRHSGNFFKEGCGQFPMCPISMLYWRSV